NPDAKWEKLATTNIGLDATLFNSLDFTAEYFDKTTSNLLVQNQPPLTTTNATQPSVNVGKVQNRGFEFSLGKRGNIIDGLRYEANVTFTHFVNKVIQVLDNPDSFLSGGATNRTQAGLPIGYFYGYKIDGFFNTQEEVNAYNATTTTWLQPAVGRWKIADRNGDGVVNDFDRGYNGTVIPDFQMGFNFSVAYKNFDLSTFLFWNQGGKIYNSARSITDFNEQAHNRSTRMLYESWTPELGNNAKLPKLDINDTYSNRNTTDYQLESASYLRMKTLQLGYNFPKSKLSRMKIDKFRAYVQAQNLFTITKFTGLDPDGALGSSTSNDLTMGVLNLGTPPTPTQILVGFNLGF
ncbi:MAG TPA: TonB-dependent receptor, partial [Cyclobacteriaceae bacterium]|nr:TonB-dependent receptor [Cyclobacteriaceae bacterium]